MKIRIFALFLALALIFPALPGNVSAAEDATAAAAAQLRTQQEQRTASIRITYGGIVDGDISLAVLEESYAHTGVPTQGDYLRHYCNRTSRGAGGTTLSYQFEYTISLEQEADLTGYLDAVMDSFGFADETDDYTKIKTVYDFVCGNVICLDDYSTDSTAYGALLGGGASDEGISALLYRMLLEAGIDNRVICDNADYWNYYWNIVELNGVYYHLDASQDAGSVVYDGFLLCDDSVSRTRGETYSSDEFYAAYPMAEADYDCERIFTGNYAAISNNTSGQYDPSTKRFGSTVSSALYAEDEGYVRVEVMADSITVETYDSDFTFLSRKSLALDLPLYGGVHIGEDYNFVISGQTNYEENDDTEVIRITRYTKDWDYVDHTSVCGANTTVPFYVGSLRCAEANGILYVRTCHQMYTSANDGLNHQASVMLAVRISDMALIGGQTGVSNINQGYVSHSFNQFIIADGDTLLALDHGDYYPRAVVMIKYRMTAGSESFSTSAYNVEVLPISTGSDHYNYTGVQVGGFQASGSHYLAAGSSADQSVDGTELGTAQQNIFVTATDKNNFTAEGTSVIWYTDYTDTAINYIHLVKISDGKFCLMWDADGTANYVFLDGTGAATSEIYTTDALLSDCVPIVSGDSIIWYAANGDLPQFYRMDLNNPGSVTEYHNHKYSASVTEPTCTAGGYTTYTCLICGESYVGKPTDVLGHSYTSAVTASTCTEQGYTTHTCDNCGDSYVDSYVSATGHSYGEWYTAEAATCTEDGTDRRDCQNCDHYEVSDIAARGHSYQAKVTAPTCTDQGCTTHTCAVCGDSYVDSYVSATGHSYGDWYTAKAAACTDDGAERRDCSVCGHYETAVIEATGHNYLYESTYPTCTEQGYVTFTCLSCADTYKDHYKDALGHDYINGVCGRCYQKQAAVDAPQVTGSNVASSGKIRLKWAAVDNAAKYQVYRATSKSGTYKLLKTTTGTSFTNTGAVAGKTYYYYVIAIDAEGNKSEQSNIVTRTCDLPRPVVSISNVASSGKIKLTWEAVDGAVKYRVYRSTSRNGTYTLMKTTTGTSYTNTSAKAGTLYYYKVVAVAEKSAANSAYSSYKSRTCDLPRPDVSIALKNGKPRLTWDAVDGAVSYKIYRSTSRNGTYTLMKTTTGTSYTNTSAKSGTTYYYRVIAVHSKSAANSAYSLADSIKAK